MPTQSHRTFGGALSRIAFVNNGGQLFGRTHGDTILSPKPTASPSPTDENLTPRRKAIVGVAFELLCLCVRFLSLGESFVLRRKVRRDAPYIERRYFNELATVSPARGYFVNAYCMQNLCELCALARAIFLRTPALTNTRVTPGPAANSNAGAETRTSPRR